MSATKNMTTQIKSHSKHASLLRLPAVTLLSLLLMQVYGCTSNTGEHVDPNLRESIRWYTGETGTVSDERAKTLLEMAVADGDPISTMWIARVYSTGRMGFAADKARAQEVAGSVIADIEQLAIADVAEAQFLMGTAYAEALGKGRDDAAATEWYRRAADAGHVLAMHNMGNIFFSGTGVDQDDSLAVYWWTKAAEAGDAIPQFRLGEMYEQGRGVEKDLDAAISWYERSASRGNLNARSALRRIQQ